MGTKLTAGVVGGGAGGRLSADALVASDRFQLTAMTDMRPQVCDELRTRYPGIRTFASHREMFAACPTDVVCVSTWPPSHEEVTRDALELPLEGILVEKPLADTAAGGRRILDAVRARRLPMAVPHGLLANRAALDIAQRVRSGAIGELRSVEIQCSRWDIINAGIHWMNYFVTLTGNEPMAYVMALCESSTRTFRDGMQVETTSVVLAETVSGVRAYMLSGDDVRTTIRNGAGGFRIVGTDGLIEYAAWAQEYRIVDRAHPAGETVTPERGAIAGHRWHLEHMASMIGAPEVDYAIPESSLLSLEICEGAYTSSRHRCKVTFPVGSFVPPVESAWDPGRPYAGTGGGRDGRKL